tara:strand:- start:557 stop:1696 length:1140 start_codon:yes stop_codon:yes gene_type:complete
MKLSIEFEDLVLKQLESFGCFMGVKHLVVYLASAKEDSKAGFEVIGQWPEIDRTLMPIDDDPEVKVSAPNRRWYPLQDKDILIGVLRVETEFKDAEWPLLLDSRLKALSISLAKSFAIEIERQRNDEEINYLKSQVSIIIHQLRNPLAALRTYAKLLIKRLGSDVDSVEIVESMLIEQNQINEYVGSFEQLNKTLKLQIDLGEERLLLPPNLNTEKEINLQLLLAPILERGKANAKLQNKKWKQSYEWPEWTLIRVSSKYGVIAEIVANLLENAFKYSEDNAQIGIIFTNFGLIIFDNGIKITEDEKEKIFQKGFRGIASRDKEGSGVGLYLARKLARQIGGDLILCDKDFDFKSEIAIQDSQKANIFYLKIPIKKFHR